MPNLFAFRNRHDIHIDLVIALRRSLLIVSTSPNFSNGIGLLNADFSESKLSRLYSSQWNRAKRNKQTAS
jgi:hypothetical protein